VDQHHFAVLTRSLTNLPTRRDLLRGLASAGIGLQALRLSDAVEAKKRKKRKKNNKKKKSRPVVNQYGCLDVGQPCGGNSALCCSGICEGTAPKKGKQDTSRCVAHNTSICTPTLNICTTGTEGVCNQSNLNCHCTVTTGNAGFCGDYSLGALNLCRVCSRDTDCQAEFGAGAACVVFEGICATYCPATRGTACMPACAV
jgi:hypothetical protein